MISIFALGSDLPEIEVIRSALSEERTLCLNNDDSGRMGFQCLEGSH